MSNNIKNFFDKKHEWSKIKDALLQCYLIPYSTKIFRTGKDVTYIDAFAGEGIFKDGALGSPLIAYNAITNAKENTSSSNDISFIFIENENYDKLHANTSDLKNCTIISNDYENCIENILEQQSGRNVFLYVDPYGIKNIKMKYFVKANSRSFSSSELLLNFNSFGFIREACRLWGLDNIFDEEVDTGFIENIKYVDSEKNDIDNMNSVAGGDYWQGIISDYKEGKIDGYMAEKLFAKKYCEKLKENTKYKYVINLPIRVGKNNHPKYRMVFASNHIEGFLIMVDSMAKRNDEMKNQQTNGMQTLFDETVENDIIDDSIIIDIIINCLSSHDEKDINDVIIAVIEEIGIYSTAKIRKIISDLENNGNIKVRREPTTTQKGKPSKFLTTSKEKKVYLSI